MQNLKIKVNNEAESREVQELLFKLGYNDRKNWTKRNPVHDSIQAWQDGEFTFSLNHNKVPVGFKEITLAELRDMVVLKRNDVNDATHQDKDDAEFKYRLINNQWHVITSDNQEWRKSSITLEESPLFVKPIEKKMQEYLNKNTYEYKLAHTKPDGEWVCIPAWANYAYNNDSGICFMPSEIGFNHPLLVWVRPTQPEALPFIDDNPQSLNEQYAEIEGVRQAIKVKSGSGSDHMADAMSYGLMGGIDATLAERQSTYGSFEDVAFVTENIMSILGRVRANGLSELPNTHRMALYMIASKMARIVNGDFNHIDGWHDIGGYAKLVEDLIKENNKTY